jgi:mannose-6-phosphate isomerase-like protein (cupin superfamily)
MPQLHQILNHLLTVYDQKRLPEDHLRAKIILSPEDHPWTIVVPAGSPAELIPKDGPEPEVHFILSRETLTAIYEGQITGLTAASRENLSDPAPLDFALPEGQPLTEDLMARMLRFIQDFFNPTLPEQVPLAKAHARLVHGAFAIPMFYGPGFRSAWYRVEKGQQLNQAGDTNPFHQAFIIIEGNGYAKIGEITTPIHPGLALHIPPDSEHIVWTEADTPLTLIFLAWGPGA